MPTALLAETRSRMSHGEPPARKWFEHQQPNTEALSLSMTLWRTTASGAISSTKWTADMKSLNLKDLTSLLSLTSQPSSDRSRSEISESVGRFIMRPLHDL